MKTKIEIQQDWKFADFEGIDKEQMRINRLIPFSEKLEWLDQAERMIEYMRSNKGKRKK